MSEYQYYEFRAIDRPLDQDDRTALRKISSRAEITATSLTNTYHYGDFKGDINALMDRYFDAFVYVANWGGRQLIFRISRSFLDPEMIQAYGDRANTLELKVRKDHVLFDFHSSDEEGRDEDWSEGESWMPALVPLRDEIMRGDYRALYLGWLASIWVGDRDDHEEADDLIEPPVPPGLAKLSEPLRSLVEFLRIDNDMIAAAAQRSEGEPSAGPTLHEFARWVKTLPTADKDDCLMRLIDGERDLLILADLSRKFREATLPGPPQPRATSHRRTVAQLLEVRNKLSAERQRLAAERSAREKAERDRKASRERDRHLTQLAPREAEAWREVDQLLTTTLPKNYDRAVELLVDLRDLARRDGRISEVDARIQQLRQTHRKKRSLIERLDRKKPS